MARRRVIDPRWAHKEFQTRCERWYGPNVENKSVKRCERDAFYQIEQNGIFMCKECAREISRMRGAEWTFNRIYTDEPAIRTRSKK